MSPRDKINRIRDEIEASYRADTGSTFKFIAAASQNLEDMLMSDKLGAESEHFLWYAARRLVISSLQARPIITLASTSLVGLTHGVPLSLSDRLPKVLDENAPMNFTAAVYYVGRDSHASERFLDQCEAFSTILRSMPGIMSKFTDMEIKHGNPILSAFIFTSTFFSSMEAKSFDFDIGAASAFLDSDGWKFFDSRRIPEDRLSTNSGPALIWPRRDARSFMIQVIDWIAAKADAAMPLAYKASMAGAVPSLPVLTEAILKKSKKSDGTRKPTSGLDRIDKDIIMMMYVGNFFNEDNRVNATQMELHFKKNHKSWTSVHIRKAMTKLKEWNLVKSQIKGPSSGYWLTCTGRARAKKMK